jgi:hypothetical protein
MPAFALCSIRMFILEDDGYNCKQSSVILACMEYPCEHLRFGGQNNLNYGTMCRVLVTGSGNELRCLCE